MLNTNWKKVIDRVLKSLSSEQPGHVVVRSAATERELDSFENTVGKRLPKEMRALYLTANGFGLSEVESGTPDFALPLESILDYAKQECEHYGETHPEFASSYLPFINLGNGDSIGYLWGDAMNAKTATLVIVSHEFYEYDAEQEFTEFVSKLPSLKAALKAT